jgi:glucose/arabinose dehydrogenase
MNRRTGLWAVAVVVVLGAVAAYFVIRGHPAKLPEMAAIGPSPTLPEPTKELIPTVNIATATGWADGGKPTPAPGLDVSALATGLQHPRWLHVLPNGDVLVAESDGPPRPDDAKGVKGFVYRTAQKRAGSGTPSANRITLIRAANASEPATKTVFIEGLNSPFGMALVGDNLYVANTDAVLRFPYHEGDTRITKPGVKVADLPAGSINHHWTKNVIASRDGARLYATVGSNSNVGENGLDQEVNRAAILEVDPKTGASRLFASGLRNPNGMDFEPQTGALWAAVNERDELGSDLVPDYMTAVKDGGFYGWPFSYYGGHVDTRVPAKPEMVAKAIVPDYALGNHTASLGLTFDIGSSLPDQYRGGAFVGQHGSWNRKPRSGYKVIFVPFAQGRPSGLPIDVLTGFVDDKGEALGRPVGVAIDKSGALLVADDVGNTVWRVTRAEPKSASADR